MKRRSFLKTAASFGAMSMVKPVRRIDARSQTSAEHFGVHPFIEEHPEAVFVMKTDVDVKTNSTAKKETGLGFAQSVFLPMDNGVPLTHLVPIKPNLTDSQTKDKDFTLEAGMGIVTDPYFVEGVIEGMKELGLSGNQFYLREVNAPGDFEPRGYTAMAQRTGADIRDMSEDVRTMSKDLYRWIDVPDPVIHREIPHLWPINAKDSFYLNIAKFKSHDIGMTLCCKNHQGSVANKYQRFCHGPAALTNYNYDNIVRNAVKNCTAMFNEHVSNGVPYWDKLAVLAEERRIWLEMWCHRTLDNISSTKSGLCIIEGVYGRDDAFLDGPNPATHNTAGRKEAWDYMTNVVIFGKNPVLVDNIGHWLAGHEPGNFGLFHLAMERGMAPLIDPRKIPVYSWQRGAAKRVPLERLPRTPLVSSYIPKEGYPEKKETYPSPFHLYDEPFDYGKLDETIPGTSLAPGARTYDNIRPNPSNPYALIEYTIPDAGFVQLAIFDGNGDRIETLANGYHMKGAHCARWNTDGRPPGTYHFELRYRDFSESKRLVLG